MRTIAARSIALGALVAGHLCAGAPAGAEVKSEDLASIKSIAGCHSVTYRFYEDGERDHFNPNSSLVKPIRELVRIEAEGPRSITLSHASIPPQGEPVPHWQEVWSFEERSGAWTQAVWSGAPESPKRE